MALKGTLKDFGIADILQLIGQQQKTGVLYIKSKAEEVEVSFLEGNVVRAQSKTRKSRELLGSMLVASGLVTQMELDEALEIQKRTLKRLGDILVAEGKLAAAQLRELTQLQTTETLYKLFTWKNGTYEFVQQDVEQDPAAGSPIRPESVLMEGFRRIDEWPMVRKKVPSAQHSFERLKNLAPPPLAPDADGDEVDAALDAALEASAAPIEPAPKSIGKNERVVFKLADPGIEVQRLCELSRLGEFETNKALFNLVEAGYLKPVLLRSGKGASSPASARRPVLPPELGSIFKRQLVQTGLGVATVLLFALAARSLGSRPQTVRVVSADTQAARRVLSDSQLARLMNALELYRLSHGKYPDQLAQLAGDGLVDEHELSYPFEHPYHYRRTKDAYVLLPPLD